MSSQANYQILDVDIHGQHTTSDSLNVNSISNFLFSTCGFESAKEAATALSRCLVLSLGAQRVTVNLSYLNRSVSVAANSVEAVTGKETKDFGTVDIVFENRKFGIYRLNIAPGRGIPLHVHHVMSESELVLHRGLLCQNRPVEAGEVFRWNNNEPHRYDNPTDKWLSVLCIDSPPFIPSDEVVVHE